MNSYNKEVMFHLPGMFMHFKVLRALIEIIEQHPEYMRDNAKIGSLYDSPTCI